MKDIMLTDSIEPSGSDFQRSDIRKQRFLIFSSLFPPDALGGAEISAYNLAKWLVKQGAEVGILTTAKAPDEVAEGHQIDGLHIWRLWMPRAYPMYYASRAKWWQKPLWHLQDHIDPRNRKLISSIVEVFKPTYIHIHLLQGLGYNSLLDIAKYGVPTTYFLHDLGLACIRMGMFKKGSACEQQCTMCRLSSQAKLRWANKISGLSFVSPSESNLLTLNKFFPVKRWPNAVVKNVNRFEPPSLQRQVADHLRILYVGRLHATKGVDVLLEAANALAGKYRFTLTLVGSGPDETSLRARYGKEGWCQFLGFLSQQEVSNVVVNSDMLCVPSVWRENSPGVIIHALCLGLPVIASDNGGIPELVEPYKNGLLVSPGDVKAWQLALEEVLRDPTLLSPWREYALENAHKFNQDFLGNELLDFTAFKKNSTP